jgi:four helix bundle protein
MGERNQSFTDLEVWKVARALKNEIRRLTETFPEIEKYRLSDQLIRSSRSINSNISEGHGRYTFKDQVHFCIQARGSLSETLNHLIDAFDCKYISREQLLYFRKKVGEVEQLLNGYIGFLRKQMQN